jgi:hypothetical protein
MTRKTENAKFEMPPAGAVLITRDAIIREIVIIQEERP